jgi:hypothetical protein
MTKAITCQMLVTHFCNPSYLGGRDQEDCGSKQALANSWRDSILKKMHHMNGHTHHIMDT